MIISQKVDLLTRFFLILFLSLFPLLYSYSATEEEREEMMDDLRLNYHRFETAYAVSRISSVKTSEKAMLQNFLISGEAILTPEVSLTARLPFVSLGNELAFTNPSIGLRGVLFEGLLKGFPSFVFLQTDLKPPLASKKEFVFRRTDISVGVSTLREVYHFNLYSDLSYILKLDSESSLINYGNELTASVGGELNTGYQFSTGLTLNYRHANQLETVEKAKIPGRSLFILKPNFSYHYDAEVTFQGTLAMPIGHQQLQDAVFVFGDYTTAGIGGNTFFLTFEKKF